MSAPSRARSPASWAEADDRGETVGVRGEQPTHRLVRLDACEAGRGNDSGWGFNSAHVLAGEEK
eukprot:5683107-Pleurochrysis_carterae.AAC.1